MSLRSAEACDHAGPAVAEAGSGPVSARQEDAVHALIERREFSAASRLAAAALAALQCDHSVLNRLINDRGRLAAALTMLDLHFCGGEKGFALTDLREAASVYGFGSPNRVTALAGALRVAGFLDAVEAADARLRKVAPSTLFLDLFRRRAALELRAGARLAPQVGQAVEALGDARFFGAFLQTELALTRGAPQPLADPGIASLAERANALVMLFAIYVAEADGVVLPVAALARRFAVARSHVLSVLKEAESHGLMVFDPGARTFRPTIKLRQALQRFFAERFLAHAAVWERGQADRSLPPWLLDVELT